MSNFFIWNGSDLILNCHLQAGAKNTEIVGLQGDSVKIRVAALPTKGKANQALTHFLSAQIGVHKQAVELLSGHNKKRKRVKIHDPRTIPPSGLLPLSPPL